MLRTGLILISFLFSFYSISAQCLAGNCQNGPSKFRFQNGALYEGAMSYGKLHGAGTLRYANGDVYKGMWHMNKREGKGLIVSRSGLTYEGTFYNNQLHGAVRVSDQEGGYYQGEWNYGQPQGQGVYVHANGIKTTSSWSETGLESVPATPPKKVTTYIADCNLVPCSSGKGRLILVDGSVYTGNFAQGLPEGDGECKYKNGDVYTGKWIKGMPQGQGTYTYANGVVLNGSWTAGKFMDPPKISKKSYAEGVNIYALIVGASRYEHFKSLMYTDDDAYQIYAFLRSPEGGAVPDDHIRILIDESAVAENIYKGLDDIIAMAGPEDMVMVYFAGHGLQGYFVPVDSDGYKNRVEYEDIKDRLSACQARQKLVIADACYSGSLLAAKTPMFESVDLFYKKLSASGGGTAFLLSSKSEEYSLESQGLKQGIFSHYLVSGLKGKADADKDNMVTLDELYTYVYTNVRTYSGNLQSPILAGDIDRSMPLANVR